MSKLVVNTKYGKLQGKLQKSIEGIEFCSFKGIPYAKPPVGELRFKDPEPLSPWNGVRNAYEFGSVCAQKNFLNNLLEGSDDCLYLNVYGRTVDPSLRQPVMVWIHGGGFIGGSGNDDMYGPDYFMRKDIVLVTINYRLGVLGFLNLEDEIAPGNQGLKDQVMALQWVRDNIASFGGDPENITIFGESAGGASVHYLAMSPLTKGLFHKVISQSGVATNPWAKTLDSKKFAFKLCENLGKKVKNNREIVEFLRTIDSKKLIEEQEKLTTSEEKFQFIFPFAPGVDDKSRNPFMPKDPQVLAEEGFQLPLLIGYTSNEGLLVFDESFSEFDPKTADFEKVNNNFEKYLNPNTLKSIRSKYNMSADDLKQIYYGCDKISKDSLQNFTKLMGDVDFVEGIHNIIKIQLNKCCAPTYAYQYTYDKGFSFFKDKKTLNVNGACHGDELLCLFRSTFLEELSVPPLTKGSTEYKLMEQMIELWVNFATHGIPTPTTTNLVPICWKPVNDSKILRHLQIGSKLRMGVAIYLNEEYDCHQIESKVQ